MLVFGYLRVSGRGQIDGDGPKRQHKAIKLFCEANRLNRRRNFFEQGVSGKVEGMDRPKFHEMIEHLEKLGDSSPKAIIVERMDRLARDLMVQEFLLAECRKRNILVYAADQGVLLDIASDGGDPTRKLIRQILGALSEWERSMLVAKLRAARQRVREKTGRCEGRALYGANATEKRILELALQLFEVVPDYGRTARLLNDAGFVTRGGKPWGRQNIRGLIVNHKKQKQKVI